MTSINVNAGNTSVSLNSDQSDEQSTEGMTQLEKFVSQKGPLDHLAPKQDLQGEAQSVLTGGYVRDEECEIEEPLKPIPSQENTVTLDGEEYVIPEGTTSVTVEDGQVLADGEVLEPKPQMDWDCTPDNETLPIHDLVGDLELADVIDILPAAVHEEPETIDSVFGPDGFTSVPISSNTEIDGSTITVDGQTFQMEPHLTRDIRPSINGFLIPDEIGYTLNEDGVAEFYVKPESADLPPWGPMPVEPFPLDAIAEVLVEEGGPTSSDNDGIQVNNPTFNPVENIDDDADIGSITYDKDQSQNV